MFCVLPFFMQLVMNLFKTKENRKKRPVGRPIKYRKLENCELDINELHDFSDIQINGTVNIT